MKKQELIDKLKLARDNFSFRGGIRPFIEIALKEVEKLDEPEKVVIPQFVADHIELCKSENKRLNVALSVSPENKMAFEMGVSLEEANEIYARAWLCGYGVEKDKLYYVINDAQQLMLVNVGYTVPTLVGFETVKKVGVLERYQLTEKQIKDYDSRYWAFKVEVDE